MSLLVIKMLSSGAIQIEGSIIIGVTEIGNLLDISLFYLCK